MRISRSLFHFPTPRIIIPNRFFCQIIYTPHPHQKSSCSAPSVLPQLRIHSQSGPSPYLLMTAWLPDVQPSLRASTQSVCPPGNTFFTQSLQKFNYFRPPHPHSVNCISLFIVLYYAWNFVEGMFMPTFRLAACFLRTARFFLLKRRYGENSPLV